MEISLISLITRLLPTDVWKLFAVFKCIDVQKLDYFVCRPGNGELWFLCVPKSRVIKCRIRGENRAQILTEELDSLPSPTSSSFQLAVPSGDLCNANPPTTPNSSGHWLWLPHRYLRWDVGPISNLHLSCFRASVFCERTDFDVFWWHHFLPVSHHTYLSFFFVCVAHRGEWFPLFFSIRQKCISISFFKDWYFSLSKWCTQICEQAITTGNWCMVECTRIFVFICLWLMFILLFKYTHTKHSFYSLLEKDIYLTTVEDFKSTFIKPEVDGPYRWSHLTTFAWKNSSSHGAVGDRFLKIRVCVRASKDVPEERKKNIGRRFRVRKELSLKEH